MEKETKKYKFEFAYHNWEVDFEKDDMHFETYLKKSLYEALVEFMDDGVCLICENAFNKCNIDDDDITDVKCEKLRKYFKDENALISIIKDLEIGGSCIHLEYIKRSNRYIYKDISDDFDDFGF